MPYLARWWSPRVAVCVSGLTSTTLRCSRTQHQHLEKALLAVTTQISQDERISSNPVARIVYGDPGAFLPHLPQKSVAHCSKMWACRRRVTVEYLQHVLEQNSGKDTVPILRKFLQKVRPPPSDHLPVSLRTRRPGCHSVTRGM